MNDEKLDYWALAASPTCVADELARSGFAVSGFVVTVDDEGYTAASVWAIVGVVIAVPGRGVVRRIVLR
ncbi:hypothetical protein [Nocardia xishanensis]|uniref:hypothetical protein n=1 Tax=Nocardia xishanensis TaxID=238964 RepID=UPI00342F52CA